MSGQSNAQTERRVSVGMSYSSGWPGRTSGGAGTFVLLSQSALHDSHSDGIPTTVRFAVRTQDILLVLMLGALIYLTHDAWQMTFMSGLALLQLIEGRVAFLNSTVGRIVSVVLQLILGYLLIGLTNGVESPYYLVLLLPVVSTASYLGVAGTVASTVVAIAAYLSFLLFIDWHNFVIDDEAEHILVIRCLLPAVAAILVNSLGEAVRTQSARHKAAADQLSEANRHLVEAEDAIRRADRLAALGQLSAGLAHELRNPLGSIKGSAELLARTASQADPLAKELAEIISTEVDRTNSLVTRFLDFARPLQPRPEPSDLTEVMERAAARAKVSIVTRYSQTLGLVPVDRELMEQVFLNLLTNAAQASTANSDITVTTAESNGYAEISVRDQGCGIPDESIESIFNPFFTSKQEGTGLGLAIVAKIVDGHGGKMKVESETGKGSTFHVLLPLQQAVTS